MDYERAKSEFQEIAIQMQKRGIFLSPLGNHQRSLLKAEKSREKTKDKIQTKDSKLPPVGLTKMIDGLDF